MLRATEEILSSYSQEYYRETAKLKRPVPQGRTSQEAVEIPDIIQRAKISYKSLLQQDFQPFK